MCGICTLPTTHANTFSTISMVSLFLMVFWTFVWAWWIVTKIRIENYFTNTFQTIVRLGKVSREQLLPEMRLVGRKWLIMAALVAISIGLLLGAVVIDHLQLSAGDFSVQPYYPNNNWEPISLEQFEAEVPVLTPAF